MLLVLALQVNQGSLQVWRFMESENTGNIDEQIARALELLREGEVVGMPTETVYGLAGDAANQVALARIFEVKNRPTFDPLIIHAPTLESVYDIVDEFPPLALDLARHFWPGALTMVLPKKDWVPALATAGLDTVAVRVPAHPIALRLLEEFGGFIAAPSANKFGKLSPTTAEAVREGLGEGVSLVIDGGACEKGLESTIVGFEEEKPVCLRLGAITIEQLEQCLNMEILAPGQFDPRLAPGNLPAHYAPQTKLAIFEERLQRYAHYPPPGQIALIRFKTQVPSCYRQAICLSPTGDLKEAAAGFFEALRACDRSGAKLILVEKFPEIGLGRALNDRLRKAANTFLM